MASIMNIGLSFWNSQNAHNLWKKKWSIPMLKRFCSREEEAKKRIYSVCTTLYTGFRAFFSKDLIFELRGLPRVRWVLSIEYLDDEDRFFEGDLFVDGKVLRRQQLPMAALSNTHFAVGRDDDLWVIPFQFPEDQEPSLGEEIDLYVKTLASVVGSEEEAKKRIYAVSSATSWYTGFRAFISKKMAHELGGIRDSENEYPNEDVHGGNLLVDGKVVFRPTFSRMQQPEFGRLLVLLNFVLDQILTDIYICKLEETETDNGGETNVRRARIFFDS